MLLPRARVHFDNNHNHHLDLLQRRPHRVVPDTGLQHIHLAAISATSGWLGEGGGRGRGRMLGRRPMTAFDWQGRRRRRERRGRAISSEGSARDEDDFEDSRTPHPLKTRSGKMAFLRERHQRPLTLSDRSASADSGLGSSPTLDRTHPDVSTSDVFDDVTRTHPSEHLAPTNSSGGGFFGAYVTRHSLSLNDPGAKLPARVGDVSSAAAVTSHDALPEHLDAFDDVAGALVASLRRSKRRGGAREEEEEFDKWHAGHAAEVEDEDCAYCRELAGVTRQRVDRYFGGTQSFLSWIFSKWGKRKELEGSFRRSLGSRGRSPHFCNFVHKVDLHTRYDGAHARAGSGSDGEDGADSVMSEATDGDILAQWRKSRLSNSGTEGRPGSPTSLDGKPRDGDVTSLQNGASEDEDVLSAKGKWKGGRRPKSSSGKAKLIPTITIPSSPIPPVEQLLSNRSSGESSPRKSAREEVKRPDSAAGKSPKPQALAVSRPSPPPPPREEKKAPEKSKRQPIAKKTRKTSDRRRKSKTVSMEPLPAETSASGEPAAANGEAEAEPPPKGPEVKGAVPDLPDVPARGEKSGKHSKRAQRKLIGTAPAGADQLQLPQELLDLDGSSRTGYDFGSLDTALSDNYNNKYNPQSWLNTRMALSQQASRFELPMDMKVLEAITPQDYLRKFCVITSRRLNLYQRIFMKHKDKANTINKQGLEACLKETLVQQLKDTTFGDLCDLLDIRDDTVIDFKLFSGAAAITERILYPCYTTEDTLEKPEYQREKIETADFGALEWKLHGIKIGDKMKKLLKTIE